MTDIDSTGACLVFPIATCASISRSCAERVEGAGAGAGAVDLGLPIATCASIVRSWAALLPPDVLGPVADDTPPGFRDPLDRVPKDADRCDALLAACLPPPVAAAPIEPRLRPPRPEGPADVPTPDDVLPPRLPRFPAGFASLRPVPGPTPPPPPPPSPHEQRARGYPSMSQSNAFRFIVSPFKFRLVHSTNRVHP